MDPFEFERHYQRFCQSLSSATKKRGHAYFKSGNVLDLEITATAIVGEVEGSYAESYETQLTLAKGKNGFDTYCDCPVGYSCKHSYAIALAAREQLYPDSAQTPSTNAPSDESKIIATIKNGLANRVGGPLPSSLRKYPQLLAQTWLAFQRSGNLWEHDVSKLSSKSRYSYYQHQRLDDLENMYEAKPSNPMELFNCLVLYHIIHDIELPENLTSLGDIEVPKRIYAQNLRKQEVAIWKDTLRRSSQKNANTTTTAAHPLYDLRLTLGVKQWPVELVDPNGTRLPLTKKRRAQLGIDDFDTGLATLIPDAAQFYAPILSHYGLGNRSYLNPLVHESRELLNQLVRLPVAQGRLFAADETPITHSNAPLTYRVEKQLQSGETNAILTLQTTDQTPLPKDATQLPASPEDQFPAAILAGSLIYDAPQLLSSDNQSWHAETIVPWESLRSAEGLAFLKSVDSPIPEDFKENVVEINLRPLIKIETRNGDDNLQLDITFTAIDENQRTVSTYKPNEWEDQDIDYPLETIPQLDWSKPAEAKANFHRISPDWHGHHSKWNLHLPKSAAQDLSDWLRAFPKHTTIQLPTHLKGLLENPAASYDFNIEPDSTQRDWFNISAILNVEDTTLTKAEIALLLKAKGNFLYLKGKGWKRLELNANDPSHAAIGRLGLEANSDNPQRYHALQLAEFAPKTDEENSPAWQQSIERIQNPTPITLPNPPAELAPLLRPYQSEGFHFLVHLSQRQFGGILADDMGLGKTLQTLAWLIWLKSQKKARAKFRVLVICPKSVVDNWLSETKKFPTNLTSTRYTKDTTKAQIGNTHLLVANYTQLRIRSDFFASIDWDAVILDEGQYIKNPTSQTAKAAYALKSNHRLVLSGTPVENRLLDLWSLMRFAMPGLLGTQASFKRVYNEKTNPQAAANIARRIKPFILRRAKSQVAKDLPPRIEEEIHCQLEGIQAKLYKAELKKAQQALLKVKTDRQFDQARFNILQSLLRMRQICCDPRLLGVDTAKTFVSSKTEALLELLEPILAEGNKILIFSQFVSQLELLQQTLDAKKIGHLTLTGKTENRKELVDRFQKPNTEQVFLLSIKAAGSGLNLTAASYVILYDPWWNPAVEAQAIDRTHRIGQKSQVIAYRLIAKDTIEEKIRALQKEKAQIAQAVIQEESLASVLDLESLRQLLD